MNKIYDKLLLLVAALLLAGGGYLYLQKAGQTPSLNAPADVKLADNPYSPESVPLSRSTEASWPEAKGNPSRPEWIYDVFTPPKIYIGEGGEFTQEGWKPLPPKPPFGIYLEKITRDPYRIQFEGYIEEDRSDTTKTLLLLYDEESKKQVRARAGDEKPEAELEVLDFEIQRIRDNDNNIEVVAQVTILDQRSGKEVLLTHGERRFEPGVTVFIYSREDPNFKKVLTQAPAEFEGPEGMYTLLEINLEESSITVEKEGTEDYEPETRTLKSASGPMLQMPPAPTPPTPTPTPPTEADSEVENIFDAF